jgi:hypothetical protein
VPFNSNASNSRHAQAAYRREVHGNWKLGDGIEEEGTATIDVADRNANGCAVEGIEASKRRSK